MNQNLVNDRPLARRGGEIFLWDVTNPVAPKTLQRKVHEPIYLSFSPDSSRLVSTSRGKPTVWDCATGGKSDLLDGSLKYLSGLAISPDGNLIAAARIGINGKVAIWNANTKEPLHDLKAFVTSVGFSPDGRFLAAVFQETVEFWDVEAAKQLFELKGHADEVYGFAFSPDGTRLATAGADNVALLWDTESGKMVLKLEGHSDKVTSIAFSPDGRQLATSSWDKTLKIWDGTPVATD